jgi:hypothetical protein
MGNGRGIDRPGTPFRPMRCYSYGSEVTNSAIRGRHASGNWTTGMRCCPKTMRIYVDARKLFSICPFVGQIPGDLSIGRFASRNHDVAAQSPPATKKTPTNVRAGRIHRPISQRKIFCPSHSQTPPITIIANGTTKSNISAWIKIILSLPRAPLLSFQAFL